VIVEPPWSRIATSSRSIAGGYKAGEARAAAVAPSELALSCLGRTEPP
jgi:hypothetical protein